jgi:hypothetical protein
MNLLISAYACAPIAVPSMASLGTGHLSSPGLAMRRRFSSLQPTARLSWRLRSKTRHCNGFAGFSQRWPPGHCCKAKNRSGSARTTCCGSAKRCGLLEPCIESSRSISYTT